jgi:predicted phosphodiesterase
MTNKQIYKSLNKSYPYDRGYCSGCGKLTTSKHDNKFICKECFMGLETDLSKEELEVIKKIRKSNLTPNEINSLFKSDKPLINSGKNYNHKGKGVYFGVIGDTHMGHQCYDANLMKHAIDTFNKEKVDFVIHAGDILEGHYENKRAGSVFELTHIGGDSQVDLAVKELSQIKKPLYFITGNHETNTFLKMSGFDIGKQIEDKIPNAHYLGNAKGRIQLPYGQSIEVLHPDGGSSYAVSYRSQKIAESLEGGTKPSILLIGHFHKAEYLFYRNIHIFQTGTLQSQTDFMRNKHLSAHKGFWLVKAKATPKGISEISPKFIPSY